MTRQNKCLLISTVKSPVEVVEEMKKEAANVSEEMTKLHARVQTQYFAQDHLEQYSRIGECAYTQNPRNTCI